MDLQIMFYSKYFTATNILTITKRPDFIGKACRRPKVLQQRDLQQLRGKRADWFCILEYWFIGSAHVLFGWTSAVVAFFKFIQCVFELLQVCSELKCLGDTLMPYIHILAMVSGLFLETICWSLASCPSAAGNSSMKRKIRVTATDLCSGAGEASSMQLSLDH